MAHVAVQLIAAARPQCLFNAAEYLFHLFDQFSGEFGSSATGRPDGLDGAAPALLRKAILDRAFELQQSLPKLRVTGLDRRLEWLGGIVGASPVDVDILRQLARAKLFFPYCGMLGRFSEGSLTNQVNLDALSAATGGNALAIRRRLEPTRTLSAAGLVRDCRGDYEVTDLVIRIANMRSVQPKVLAKTFLVQAPRSTLRWSDFEHLGALIDVAKRVVFQAAKRKTGVNVLLYGVPGTGKSEFARALAEACGLTAVLVGSSDDAGNEPTRSERLGHLAVCSSLVARSGSHLLVVDEADDLMVRPVLGFERQASKYYLNSRIERPTSPTVWIVNDPKVLGAPVVRRMGLALEFTVPGPVIRERIVARIAAAQKLSFGELEIGQIARIEASPAIFENALRAARWTDGSAETACSVAKSVQRALGERSRDGMAEAANFDPALCVSDVDLAQLAERLINSGSRAWSLLASGPPGTGKSAFARHVAGLAGLRVIEKKASDLLDMYLGNTEKRIAKAFEEAADCGAMLIMDEADSLLRNRELAQHSWEATMTNEMLTWMERTPVPFVATTNLRNCLDPATTRRFLFKVELSALDPRRAAGLFKRFFGSDAPARLHKLEGLTPGDFALVARKAAILDENRPDALLELLEYELRAKPEANRKPLGF